MDVLDYQIEPIIITLLLVACTILTFWLLRVTRRTHNLQRLWSISYDLQAIASFTEDRFVMVNPAFTRLLGWTEYELTHRPWSSFAHPDDIPGAADAFERVRKGSECLRYEMRSLQKDGTFRWLEWNGVPDTNTGFVYLVARDISSLRTMIKEIEQRREDAEAAAEIKAKFLATMSHEVSPLLFARCCK